jgi:hypothetical protein
MRNQTLKNVYCLLALVFLTSMILTACRSTDEHPAGNTKEHPEHPTTNAPAQKP